MIPGKSRIWIFAPLYMTCPGTVVKVVNSYAAATHDYQYFFLPCTKTRGSSRTFGMLASQSTHQRTLPHGREANESPSIWCQCQIRNCVQMRGTYTLATPVRATSKPTTRYACQRRLDRADNITLFEHILTTSTTSTTRRSEELSF